VVLQRSGFGSMETAHGGRPRLPPPIPITRSHRVIATAAQATNISSPPCRAGRGKKVGRSSARGVCRPFSRCGSRLPLRHLRSFRRLDHADDKRLSCSTAPARLRGKDVSGQRPHRFKMITQAAYKGAENRAREDGAGTQFMALPRGRATSSNMWVGES